MQFYKKKNFSEESSQIDKSYTFIINVEHTQVKRRIQSPLIFKHI